LHDIFSKTVLVTATHAAHARELFLSKITIDLRINCQNAFSSRHVRQCHEAIHVCAVTVLSISQFCQHAFIVPPFFIAVRNAHTQKCAMQNAIARYACSVHNLSRCESIEIGFHSPILCALFFYPSSSQDSSYLYFLLRLFVYTRYCALYDICVCIAYA